MVFSFSLFERPAQTGLTSASALQAAAQRQVHTAVIIPTKINGVTQRPAYAEQVLGSV